MTASTLKELKQQERQNRRELIVSAAQKLFAEKDFRRVTAREIAKTSGVSPGTIYRYYRNLDELFLDIFIIHARELSDLVGRLDRKNGDVSVHQFCHRYISYLNDNMTFYQMMGHFMLAGDMTQDTAHKLDPIMRPLMDSIEKVILKAGVRDNSRLTAHALFSALNGAMISYARYPGRSLEEIKRHTLRLAKIIADGFVRPDL